VIGAPEKDPSAPAVELARTVTPTATSVAVLEQAGEMAAGHVAGRALTQRVSAQREEIAAKEYGSENKEK
jgi:hypothetical protein